MMKKTPLLQDKIYIFNNRAKSGESTGRLSARYNIYPAPAIFWEFETETQEIDVPQYDGNGKLAFPFECHHFGLTDPTLYPTDELEIHLSLGRRMTGTAARAIVGDSSLKGKSFTFFLPNAKFQELGMLGKNFHIKEITYKRSKEITGFESSFREGFLQANIGNSTTLELQTPIDAINWLRKPRSIGTYITTQGKLFTENEITIEEAADLLDDVAFLLSFANGGSIAPLVVNMSQLDFKNDYPGAYTAYVVDPVEHIAGTWLDKQSDISDLLKCFPSFQKMLQSDQWKENYWLILMWYFQAIQPLGIQLGGKPWPVAANALGAALEKLSSIILLNEKKIVKAKDFKSMHLEGRIRKLLEAIGITIIGPKYEIKELKYGGQDAVWWFVKMRNDATHSKSIHKWKQYEVDMFLGQAIQWVEEILLWRLGYEGGYSDRSRDNEFLPFPRYKVDLRDPTW